MVSGGELAELFRNSFFSWQKTPKIQQGFRWKVKKFIINYLASNVPKANVGTVVTWSCK
jgi:hypothetical protein